MLSQDALVGVKCTWNRGGFARHPRIHFGFMGAVVVHNEMDIEIGGNSSVDSIEEFAKLNAATATVAFPNDHAGLHIQSGEKRGRAVPCMVVCPALNLAWSIGNKG